MIPLRPNDGNSRFSQNQSHYTRNGTAHHPASNGTAREPSEQYCEVPFGEPLDGSSAALPPSGITATCNTDNSEYGEDSDHTGDTGNTAIPANTVPTEGAEYTDPSESMCYLCCIHQPNREKDWRRALFDLARALKGRPEYADAGEPELSQVAAAWYAQAEFDIGESLESVTNAFLARRLVLQGRNRL